MDIRCPSCSKLFRVADEKIAGKGIRFKCSKCAEVITITKDDFEMDLLARDASATAPQAAPAAQPVAAPPPPPQPAAPAPAPEPEAREYTPPQDQPAEDQAIPPSSLGDFDFSEPHAAAAAAAHPDDGFASGGLSFDAGPEQQANAPEAEASPAAAPEAEAALQFPADLISEPKRKPAFSTEGQEPSTSEPEADASDGEMDLGAALAIPKEPVPASAAVSAASPAAPKGPVITPELLAELKRNAQQRPAGPAKSAPSSADEIDLGTALAMPKNVGAATSEPASRAVSASLPGSGEPSSGRTGLIIGITVVVMAAALGALYFTGFLGIRGTPVTPQKPQAASQAAGKKISPEGLSVADPVAYFDPERGDLVITGRIRNALDKPKTGWFLVVEVRDAKEHVLTVAAMANGGQRITERDRELLAKRGVKPEQIRAMTAQKDGTIPAGGSVGFEVRVLNPPADSARFLPVLKAFDPAILQEGSP